MKKNKKYIFFLREKAPNHYIYVSHILSSQILIPTIHSKFDYF